MNYQEILNIYNEKLEKEKILKEKAEKIKEQIEKLKQKYEKQENKYWEFSCNNSWINSIIVPVAKEMIKRHPEVKAYEIYGPFGLNASTSIHFYASNKDKKAKDNVYKVIGYLNFRPSKNGIKIHTGEYEEDYNKGLIDETSIYALNNNHYIMEEVTSLEQIDKYLVKSIEEYKKERTKNVA